MPRAVLIVGAGPSGLATAACLERRGLRADLVDRHGVAGGAYRRIHSAIVLASPARYTALPGLAPRSRGEYISVPEYRAYLDDYAAHHGLQVRKACVEEVRRDGPGFSVRFEGQAGRREYDAVVVATGMFDFPRWPQIEGLEAAGLQVLHSSEWRGPAALRGPRLLIIGGATSAIEIAEECARAGLRPVVSVRGRDVKIAPQRFLGRDLHDFVTVLLAWLPRGLARAYCEGRQSLPGTDLGFRELRRRGVVTVRGAASRVEGKSVLFADGAREEFDVLVCATGHRYEVPFLPPEVERAPSGQPLADRCQSRSWPGLYVVGMPCVRRLASEFLYGIAADAPRVARCLA